MPDESETPKSPPILDERIEFHGTSFLRTQSAETLRDLENIVVIQSSTNERIAVIMPYVEYMALQKLALKGRD